LVYIESDLQRRTFGKQSTTERAADCDLGELREGKAALTGLNCRLDLAGVPTPSGRICFHAISTEVNRGIIISQTAFARRWRRSAANPTISLKPSQVITPEQSELLRTLQQDSFSYFVHKTNPANGLVLDKSRAGWPASIAAVDWH